MSIAVARAGGDTSGEAIDRALSDPLTLDLVLNEGGWFARFLEDRGPLLPSDEALLATSWALVDRTIFELLTVRRGAGMTVKDLRTAEEMEVRERTFSNHASAGMLVCARAVPDGNEHQFLGGLFNVRTGTEAALLDLLDEADPEAIAAWAAALDRPPVLLTRENEPSIMCKAVIGVPDEQSAAPGPRRQFRSWLGRQLGRAVRTGAGRVHRQSDYAIGGFATDGRDQQRGTNGPSSRRIDKRDPSAGGPRR